MHFPPWHISSLSLSSSFRSYPPFPELLIQRCCGSLISICQSLQTWQVFPEGTVYIELASATRIQRYFTRETRKEFIWWLQASTKLQEGNSPLQSYNAAHFEYGGNILQRRRNSLIFIHPAIGLFQFHMHYKSSFLYTPPHLPSPSFFSIILLWLYHITRITQKSMGGSRFHEFKLTASAIKLSQVDASLYFILMLRLYQHRRTVLK